MDYKTVTDIFSKSLSFLSDTQTTVRLSEASSAIPVDLSKYNEKVRKKNKSMEVITKVNTKVKPENIDIFDFSEKFHNTINRPVTADIKADANVKAGNVNTSDFLNTLYGTMNSLFTGFGINLKIGAGGIINKSSGPEKGNATGTPYFGGGLTQINENGGEIINLPTGAQIIPSDKSAQMVKENARNKIPNISMINMSPVSFEYTPYFGRGTEMQGRDVYFDNFLNSTDSKQETKKFGDININVNIDGNIIGPDNFADEVGGKICGQVADLLNSM